jgi:hypothetical protein
MQLTDAERRDINLGRLRVVDEATKQVYVLIKEEMFQRIQSLLVDDGPLTEKEKQHVFMEAGMRAGWNDPEMDIYNDLDPRKAT